MESFQEPTEPTNTFEPIDLYLFREHIQQSIYQVLETMPKKDKILILEESCIPKLSYFTDIEALEKRGVNRNIRKLTENPFQNDIDILVFIIPPIPQTLEWIENQIKKEQSSFAYNAEANSLASNKEYHVIFITKINNECFNYINSSLYRGFFITHNLNAEMYPLDYDLISLEEPNSLREMCVDNNLNTISVLARSIIKFETIFGKIKNKYGKGNYANLLLNLVEQQEENAMIDNENEILACVVMDRNVDFLTMFASNFVYEGLINDFFNINLESINVSPEILSKEESSNTKIDLSSKDKFYYMIKDFVFSKISMFLPARLKQHDSAIEQGKKYTEMSEVSESLKKIMAVKKERPSLIRHINIAEYIAKTLKLPKTRQHLEFEQILLAGDQPENFYEFIENEISIKTPLNKVIRMLCIYSLVQNGLKQKNYESIKKDVLLTYGSDKIFLFKNLEKMNILKPQSKSHYSYLKDKLNLIKEKVNLDVPDDASYAYVGYCPLTIRLIEALIREGWKGNADLMKLIPGELRIEANEKDIINVRDRTFILLVFVGGITFGEIAAIRYLNSTIRTHKFIILTTSIINTDNILNQLCLKISDQELYTMDVFYKERSEKK